MSNLVNKHVLFISYDGLTDPLGQSQVIPYLCGLTKYGYRFTILSAEKPAAYRAHKTEVAGLLKNYPIQWETIRYHSSPAVLSSIYDYQIFKRKAAKIFSRDPFVMVHTRPGLPTLTALWLKRKFNLLFLNDVRGFWADERVDGGMWNLQNPVYRSIYRFFKQHEYDCLNQADAIVCLTHAAKAEMLTWKQITHQPLSITVIPCSADLELFDPEKQTNEIKAGWRKKLGITENDVVFSYLGSIGGWYLTDEMMQFCSILSKKIPEAKFLFISPHRHEQIKEAAQKNGISLSQICVQAARRKEVPELLSLSQYAIFFIRPCYSKMSSSPTKHGEIMAMGIPVITNSGVGDVAGLVLQNNAGFLLDDFSDASFRKLVDQIAAKQKFDANAIRESAKDIYSLTSAVEKYASVYQQLLP